MGSAKNGGQETLVPHAPSFLLFTGVFFIYGRPGLLRLVVSTISENDDFLCYEGSVRSFTKNVELP